MVIRRRPAPLETQMVSLTDQGWQVTWLDGQTVHDIAYLMVWELLQ